MPIAYVRDTPAHTTVGTGTTLVFTPAVAGQGNSVALIVGVISDDTVTSASISAVVGGGLTWIRGPHVQYATSKGVEIWYGFNASGAGGAITITAAVASDMTANAIEFSGVPIGVEDSTTNAGTTNPVNTGNITTRSFPAVIISCFGDDPPATGPTNGNAVTGATSSGGNRISRINGAYQIVSGTVGTQNNSWTEGSAGAAYGAAIIALGVFVRPFVVDVRDYGAKGDYQTDTNNEGTMTSGSATLTAASGPFNPTDVGKSIVVQGAGVASSNLVTTISAWVSKTQVTLAQTAGTSVTTAGIWWFTDDTRAIQAAIDYAESLAFQLSPTYSPTAVPAINFGAGAYAVTATLIAKNAVWIGVWPNNGCKLVWCGTQGGGPLVLQATQLSFWLLEKMELQGGATNPGTLIAFTTKVLDAYLRLNEVEFAGSVSDAIQITGGIYHLHWDHLRFDSCGGYAINYTVHSGDQHRVFSISDCVYDNSGAAGTPLGFLNIDNSIPNMANLGVFRITDIDFLENSGLGGNKTFINLKGATSSPNLNWIGLQLQNLNIYNFFPTAGMALIYAEQGGAALYDVVLVNVHTPGITALFNGTNTASGWAGLVVSDQGTNVGFLHFNGAAKLSTFANGGVRVISPSATVQPALAVEESGDTNDRWLVDTSGAQKWGPGNATQDVTLKRLSAGVLQALTTRLVADDGLTTKVFAGTPTDSGFAHTPADGTIAIDSSANKLWVRIGGVWRGIGLV